MMPFRSLFRDLLGFFVFFQCFASALWTPPFRPIPNIGRTARHFLFPDLFEVSPGDPHGSFYAPGHPQFSRKIAVTRKLNLSLCFWSVFYHEPTEYSVFLTFPFSGDRIQLFVPGCFPPLFPPVPRGVRPLNSFGWVVVAIYKRRHAVCFC